MDETPLGIEMHCIESSVSSVSGVTHQSHAAGMPLSRCGADGGADGGADARTASTTTWREKPVSAVGGSAASSRTSFVSDAATEVGEHHPHGPLSRDAISTAPTLHSRSSTPVVPAAPVPADRATGSPQTPCAGGKLHGAWNRFAVFWTQHISVEVPGSAARDHLAIERTFLAYSRTSLVLALTGTLVAQLFVLNHKANPSPYFGFHALGKPLAVTLVSLSLGFTILGWWRWYNWQRNTIRGVCVVGGWELESILFIIMLFLLTIFGIIIGIGIDKVLLA